MQFPVPVLSGPFLLCAHFWALPPSLSLPSPPLCRRQTCLHFSGQTGTRIARAGAVPGVRVFFRRRHSGVVKPKPLVRLVKWLGVARNLGTYTCRPYVPFREDDRAAMFDETEMSIACGERHCDLSTMPSARATVPAKRSISAHRSLPLCAPRKQRSWTLDGTTARNVHCQVNPVSFARRLVNCFARALFPENLQSPVASRD